MAPRPWVTCVGATAAHRACCALSFWRGCPSGLPPPPPTVARGPAATSARGVCAASVRRWPVDRPQSGGVDGRRTRARGGLAPTRLGGAEGDQLVGAEA